jgi:hypothetical protein
MTSPRQKNADRYQPSAMNYQLPSQVQIKEIVDFEEELAGVKN